MLYLDFRFEDLKGQLVVIGWSDMPGVLPQLGAQAAHEPVPAFVDRYARADLGSAAPLAFVAIFAARSLASTVAMVDGVPEMALEADGHSCPLPPPDRGFLALAQTGVKEAFDRVLLLVATGRLTLTVDPAATAVVRRRLGDYPVGKLESQAFAVAIDRSVVSGDGAGMLYGWFMAQRSTATLHGLKVSDNVMSALQIFDGQIERPDLAGFKARYEFTGRDGFVAATVPKTTSGPAGETQLVLAVEMGSATQIIVAQALPGGADLVGQTLAALHHALKRTDHRRALVAGVLGPLATGDLDPSAQLFGPIGTGGAAIVVDVDMHGDFVADLCLALYREDLAFNRIVLMVDPNDSAAFQAMDRTRAELADFASDLQIAFVERGGLGPCLRGLQAEGFVRVTFARASVLFHAIDRNGLALAQVVQGQTAQVLVFSPLAEQVGVVQAELTLGYQSLITSAPLAALQDSLGRVPPIFVTEEAQVKYITARLPGCFQRRLAPDEGLLFGQDGRLNALMVEGQNAYTVDSLILSMILRPEVLP